MENITDEKDSGSNAADSVSHSWQLALVIDGGLPEMENKKQFQKSREIFGNPLMGYAPSAWYEKVSEDISLLYMDITWAELEPEEGIYAWDSIEEENQINRWKKEGKHLILRFVCDTSG